MPICPTCKEEFIKTSKAPNKLFCSKKCCGISKRKIINKICPTCKKQFEKKSKYCSKECARESFGQRKGKTLTKYKTSCVICNKEFYTVPSQNAKTCSVECAGKHRSNIHNIIKQCNQCGEDFTSILSKGTMFCSIRCSMIYRHKNNEKGTTSRKRKLELLNISPWCNICGYDMVVEILQIHHLNHNKFDQTPHNTVLLCPNCHEESHFKQKTGRYKNNLGKN